MRQRTIKDFWKLVDKNGPVPMVCPELGPCWEWQGYRSSGYGQMMLDGKMRGAHVIAYEDTHGPIPAGRVLDHLCRRTTCVNPAHVEPVTQSVNVRRGLSPRLTAERNRARHAAKTHCKAGHLLSGENMKLVMRSCGRVDRNCRACLRAANERYKARRSAT